MDNYRDDFNGIIAELSTWFDTGTLDQRERLIIAVRNCTDQIHDTMPAIDVLTED